ncbi:MAG: hypothetical protein V1492_04885 [Candidatus Micrarchaeota archaeon]
MLEFLSGSIKIDPEKPAYKLGEKVNATVTLDLKSPVKARGITAELLVYYKTTRVSGSGRNRHSHTETVILHQDVKPLAGEGTFTGKTTYPVSFDIPNNPNLLSKPGLLGFIGGVTVYWELKAKLDIPGGMDINNTKPLSVSG